MTADFAKGRGSGKTAILLPCREDVKTDFAFSMWGLLRRHHDEHLIIYNARSSLIPLSRYLLAKLAVDGECDAALFIDTDMSFPEDALERLRAHDRDIVGATYVVRREPFTVLGYGIEDIEPGATGAVMMDRMPVGFCLIRTEVFRNTPKPWFPVTWSDETEQITGEDYGFCRLAREAGYDLWCDLDLSHELGHVGSQTLTWGKAEATGGGSEDEP